MTRPLPARAVVAVAPVRDFYCTPHRLSALGATAVADLLRAWGCDVHLRVYPRGRAAVLPLPPELAHLAPVMVRGECGPTAFFRHFQRFGVDFEVAAADIIACEPDVVFLSCFAFAYAMDSVELAGAVKKRAPAVPIVVGGAAVSALPAFFARYPCFDAVVTGEAETALAGLFGREPDPTVRPVWSSLRRTVSISLSRGCPFGCRFCSNFLTHGRAFRRAPIDWVRTAVEAFPGDTTTVNFEDDNLAADPEYFAQVIAGVLARFPGVRLCAENGLDYRLLTPDLVDRLLDAGMRHFNLSLADLGAADGAGAAGGAGADQQRRRDLQQYETVVARIAADGRSRVTTYLICGLPGDTEFGIDSALAYVAGRPSDIGISLFYPVPGLPGFEDPALFMDTPPLRTAGSAAWPWTGALSTNRLVAAFRSARTINAWKALQAGAVHAAVEVDLIRRSIAEQRLYTLVKVRGQRRIVAVPNVGRPFGLPLR